MASWSWRLVVSVSMRRAFGASSGAGVDQDGFCDAGEVAEELANGQVQSGLAGPQPHQAGDLQGEDAGEDVDADVVLGPVEHPGERDHARVFELPEGELGLGLGPVGGDDLGGGPAVVPGDEDVLAE